MLPLHHKLFSPFFSSTSPTQWSWKQSSVSFLMLLLTNYQKFSFSHQHKFIILQLCLLESHCISYWAKIKVLKCKVCITFWRHKGRKFSVAFPSFCRWPALLNSWLCSIFKPTRKGPALSIECYSGFAFVITSSLTLTLLLPLSTFKDPCSYTGPPWIARNTPSIWKSADEQP